MCGESPVIGGIDTAHVSQRETDRNIEGGNVGRDDDASFALLGTDDVPSLLFLGKKDIKHRHPRTNLSCR